MLVEIIPELWTRWYLGKTHFSYVFTTIKKSISFINYLVTQVVIKRFVHLLYIYVKLKFPHNESSINEKLRSVVILSTTDTFHTHFGVWWFVKATHILHFNKSVVSFWFLYWSQDYLQWIYK